MTVFVVWVGTKSNPADAPSRRDKLPSPEPLPKWAEQLFACTAVGVDANNRKTSQVPHRVKGQGLRAREYHAGAGGVAMAQTEIGIDTVAFEPYQHNTLATYVDCFDLSNWNLL